MSRYIPVGALLIQSGSLPFATRQDLLQWLEDPATSLRLRQVEPACECTFDWLFANEDLRFHEWLREGSGLYWIRGKPASGKSTLMRFACEDMRTTVALTGATTATFFFHDRGSYIQKSFEGLLKSLVYQVLEQNPELFKLLKVQLPPRENALTTDETETFLMSIFECILDQNDVNCNLCFFLDALDEYSGNPAFMAQFLKSLVRERTPTQAKLKICFSSRPLQIFLDSFKNVPGFALHKHTFEDIKTVVASKMRGSVRMAEHMDSLLITKRLAAQKMAHEIASRAEGVFLWIRLVLDELLQDFAAGDSMDSLLGKLSSLPDDLEQYYQRMLVRIPQKYHQGCLVMFEIVRCAIAPLNVVDFVHAYRFASMDSLADCTSQLSMAEVSFDEADRLVRSRCGLLVEIRTVETSSSAVPLDFSSAGPIDVSSPILPFDRTRMTPVVHAHVQFIHQTVKTFAPKLRTTLALSPTIPDYTNGYVHILKFLLACVVAGHGRENYFHDHLLSYAKFAELTTGRPQSNLLRQVSDKAIFRCFHSSMWEIEMTYPPITSVVSFAVVADLQLSLNDLLSDTTLSKASNGVPPLHIAFHHRLDGAPVFRAAPFNHAYDRLAVAGLLLDHGADVHKSYDGRTAFEMMWTARSFGYRLPTIAALELFLKHGQSAGHTITYEERIQKHQYRTVTCKPIQIAVYEGAINHVRLLLDYGAKVNNLDEDGLTELDLVLVAFDGACQSLLQRRNQPSGTQTSSSNDLLDASGQGEGAIPMVQARFTIASLLLDQGAKSTGVRLHSPLDRSDLDQLKMLGIEVDHRLLDPPKLTAWIQGVLRFPASWSLFLHKYASPI
jgi:hypothetical protein